MNASHMSSGWGEHFKTSIRLALATMFVCSLLYPLFVYGVGQVFTPFTANGSLLRDGEGKVVGSAALAQAFTKPQYFHARPSAVAYNAAAAGASNLSPAGPEFRARVEETLKKLGVEPDVPVPADLVTTSGSGMDPDITLAAARFQASRVAAARNMPLNDVFKVLDDLSYRPGGMLTPEPLVNVLRLNLALDDAGQSSRNE